MKYYIGCCGWKGQEWAKNFYPSGLDSQHHLSYYSKQFNLVHLDLSKSLFPPGSVALKKWANETSDDFRFTVKIPQNLINQTATSGQFESVGRFLESLHVLEEKNSSNIIIPASPSIVTKYWTYVVGGNIT